MDKENVVCIHNGVLFRHKEQNCVPVGKWLKLEMITIKQNKSGSERQYHVFCPAENLD
jgi:hypothetical protein